MDWCNPFIVSWILYWEVRKVLFCHGGSLTGTTNTEYKYMIYIYIYIYLIVSDCLCFFPGTESPATTSIEVRGVFKTSGNQSLRRRIPHLWWIFELETSISRGFSRLQLVPSCHIGLLLWAFTKTLADSRDAGYSAWFIGELATSKPSTLTARNSQGYPNIWFGGIPINWKPPYSNYLSLELSLGSEVFLDDKWLSFYGNACFWFVWSLGILICSILFPLFKKNTSPINHCKK